MTFFVLAFVAGLLTVLAPCVLPLLPVIIGSTIGARSRLTPYLVIGSLALSILLFTFLLKASTLFITINPAFWTYLSGGIIVLVGLTLLYPALWQNLPGLSQASRQANAALGNGHTARSWRGDVLIGIALGPVFSTCSPTYLVVVATILPTNFFLGTAYLLTYLLGLVMVLALIAYFGQSLLTRFTEHQDLVTKSKRYVGGLFMVVGLFIMTGLDKQLERLVLDSQYFDITRLEARWLKSLAEPSSTEAEPTISVPPLESVFPQLDWTKQDATKVSALATSESSALSGLLDRAWHLVPASETQLSHTETVLIVSRGQSARIYPFSLLNELINLNDTLADEPIFVSYCPLCNTATAYSARLPDGRASTFSLTNYHFLDNIVLYDEVSQSLWLQASGESIAGSSYPGRLNELPFTITSLGEALTQVPHALVVELLP